MNENKELLRTPLYENHLGLKGKMVPFGGWEMPVQYEGILAEYDQTRNKASLFDISHMGEFVIEGDCEKTGLDKILTMRLVDLPVGFCRYGLMLNERGGVIDDCIIFRLKEEQWFLVVNAATARKDLAHLKANISGQTIIRDVSFKMGKLDIQGPKSRKILKKFVPDIEKLNYYMFDYFDLLGENVLISRTGYTGELGYEIYYPWEKTSQLWDGLLEDEELAPAGLGARDVLRLEMGYSLYGHELTEDIPALESGLEKFIDFEKDFIGKPALLTIKEKGMSRKIVGIISDSRRSPRAEQKIYDENEVKLGSVTSGSFSPVNGCGIGLGFVALDKSSSGQTIFIGSEKNRLKARICSRIFYKTGSLKN